MKLLVVESPSKAKIIGKYIGQDYKVISSGGHIRELPSKNGSVDVSDFSMSWILTERGKGFVKEVKKYLSDVSNIILATDPDREGEGIAWHISEVIKDIKQSKSTVNGRSMQRISFNAVTKKDVINAIHSPREVDMCLVDAYKTRLRIDYLFGFNISPVLWRKLPGSKSAGRVQSVALRLLVERAQEIAKFVAQEYWTIDGKFSLPLVNDLLMRLVEFDGKKLDKLDIKNEEMALNIEKSLKRQSFFISDIQDSNIKKNPNPPFNTATLQQSAVNELNMRAVRVMRIAQDLYEGMEINGEMQGLITYMRTDSIVMSDEAIVECRKNISDLFGDKYVSESIRVYKSKAKNAQEAHEAIRPTDFSNTPDKVRAFLSDEHFRVYDIIWRRAVASQMASALLVSRNIKASSKDGATFSVSGSKILFDGFYIISRDKNNESFLPDVEIHSKLNVNEFLKDQHFTKPSPNYTEASLVKKLEEIGVGRPSTYARIFQVLIDREYAFYDGKAMIPHYRGIIVTQFLIHFFAKYIEYDFTAEMENALDEVSSGNLNANDLMKTFWTDFSKTVMDSSSIQISQVLSVLQNELSFLLFPQGDASKICPKCNSSLELRLGKINPFIGCSAYANGTCSYVRSLDGEESNSNLKNQHGYDIEIVPGPYGKYLRVSFDGKMKNISLTGINDEITPDKAIFLYNLPANLGEYNESPLDLCIGRFGPYVKNGSIMASLKKNDNVFDITFERAVDLIYERANKVVTENFVRKKTAVAKKKYSATRKKKE
ncbi:type I DNA topoisomerase [Candidatus Gromoviella agglomerans]|uniref:type I DNA topoisomerase n=1 Tax=Candidatus Gromoviella agglomerans TaxID=2806609 RepID=UPI001E64045C|nr:type I DNA topoisomerase [Candidatus Gromoviella agglomerans]UFX98401.1 DNA topoisomerase 1 [Candidatus Gromoviella agglomerans]